MRRDLVEAASLYAVARLILRSAELAEDAVQEALERAWRLDAYGPGRYLTAGDRPLQAARPADFKPG